MVPSLVLLFGLLMAQSNGFVLDISDVWNSYQDLYLKDYATTDIRDKFATFNDASASVVQHNIEADLEKHSFWIGLNQWSHMNKTERQEMRNCVLSDEYEDVSRGLLFNSTIANPPDSLDYRNMGMVTRVKDQTEQCGSCYAFAALTSLEGVWAKKKKKLVELSEQNIVDCALKKGCVAGTMELVFDYVKKNHGVDTFQSYPYEAKVGPCRFKPENVGATCRGYIRLPKNERFFVKSVYEIGPAGVTLHTNESKFDHYKRGVYYSDNCDKKGDHGVAIVGYGTERKSKKPYWILKNSWGSIWGEKGYMRIARNKNMCRITYSGRIAAV